MSQFYTTYAALVAHLQESTAGGERSAAQLKLLGIADAYLQPLKDIQSAARMAGVLAETLDAAHDELDIHCPDIPEPLNDLLNGSVNGSVKALRGMAAILAN